MNSMNFYIATCRCVMQADPYDRETWIDLYRLLPCLRRSLLCYVCGNILLNPIGPTHNVCPHHVCKLCRGGKMRLKPSCSWCKNHDEFEENKILKILVSCFKKLCEYIQKSPIETMLLTDTVNGETNNLVAILEEAASFVDDYVPTSTGMTELFPLLPGTCTTSHRHLNTELNVHANKQEPNSVSLVTETHKTRVSNNYSNGGKAHNLKEHQKLHASSGQENPSASSEMETESDKNDVKSKCFKRRLKWKKDQWCKSKLKAVNRSEESSSEEREDNIFKHGKSVSLCKKDGKGDSKLPNENGPMSKEETTEPSIKKEKPAEAEMALKHKPCRCGKAGTNNQLTCLGQRCPCYSMKLPCIDCKCRGCRNPKKGTSYMTNIANTCRLSKNTDVH